MATQPNVEPIESLQQLVVAKEALTGVVIEQEEAILVMATQHYNAGSLSLQQAFSYIGTIAELRKMEKTLENRIKRISNSISKEF